MLGRRPHVLGPSAAFQAVGVHTLINDMIFEHYNTSLPGLPEDPWLYPNPYRPGFQHPWDVALPFKRRHLDFN